jgi:hypothetical protein
MEDIYNINNMRKNACREIRGKEESQKNKVRAFLCV